MKLMFLLSWFLFLLSSFLLGKDSTSQVPRISLTPGFNGVKDEKQPNESLEESQPFKPDPPWISMYIPVRSCHRELKQKYGEFSPPEYLNGFEGNIWCNWTVWAGSRKNIIIYISGFKSDEGCDKNENKMFFHGVSSLAENTVVYACWGKETHVFATYAKAVHVILLMRHTRSTKKEEFVGKYYVFQPKRTRPASKDSLSSAMPSLELVLTAIPSIPQPKEASSLFTLNHSSAHISESHEVDNPTDLNGSLPTSRKNAIITAITGSARKSTASKDSEKSSCALNPSDKLIGVTGCVSWRMGNEDISVDLGDTTTSSSLLSNVSYLASGTLTKALGHPSRMLSAPLGLLMNDHQWVRGKLAQQDYLATAMPSLIISSSMVTMNRRSPGTILDQSFRDVQLAMHEAMSRSVVGFEPTSLSSLGHNRMAPTSQNDYFLVSVKPQERGKQENEASSSVFTINDANSSNVWETRRMLVLKNSTELWAIGPITEAIVEATSQMEVPFASALPSSTLEVDWNLRPRSSYHELSGTSPSLILASEMPSGTDNFSSDAQRILHWHLATKQTFLFPSRTITAPLVPAELGLSHCVVLRVEDAFSLSALTLKPSLFHNTETTLSLALPDPEPLSLELEHALFPSMPVTYPSLSVRPHQTLPVSAIFQKATFLELEHEIFSPRELDVSLNAGWLESVPLGLWCDTAGTAATLQAPFNLEDLSPAASVLEPRYPENILPARETSFFLINEVTSPCRLPMANTFENEMFLSSAYCQHMVSASKQEDISLIAGLSSGLYSSHHIDLEHQESLIKQPLLGERERSCFGTVYGEGEKGDTAKSWDIISKTTLCSSLDRFTLSPNTAWNHFVPELPLVSLPAMSKEMQSANIAQYDLVISGTAVILLLPHNEMQAPTKLSAPLEVREEGREEIKEPIKSWGKLHNAQWQWGAMECIVADLDAPRTLTETPILWENLDLPALQAPSSLDNKVTSKVGARLNCRDLGFPWLQVYLPVKSCHAILKNEAGHFSPPVLSRSQTNSWCNWTIWAGAHKHILIYVEGFEGRSNCEEDQDKIIFQGVSSSVESKVAYACRNHGTLIFATRAVAVQVVFLSKSPSQYHSPKHFKGRYYIFADYGTQEPFPKPNSSAEFSRKSSIMHLGHILDFLTTRTPNNDGWLTEATKKNWKENDRAGTLEAVLRPAASNHTQTSFLKSEESVTMNPLAMKVVHVAKPSFHDTKSGNESSSGNLKKMLGLESNHLENEDKPFVHNLTGLSTSALVSQKPKTMTKLVEVKDHETATESTHLQNGNHITTHLMTTFTEDSVKAMFGKGRFKNTITFPQVLIEEPRTPTQPPKSILEKRQKPSLQSNFGVSRKNTAVVEDQQHKRLQEALERQQMDNQVSRQENSNSKKNTVVVLAGGNTSQLITETPQSSVNKSKPQLTTLDYPNVLHDLSLRALNHNLVDTASTLSPQVVLSHHSKSIEVEMTGIPPLNSSVTGNKEQPPRKYTRANPPYFPSGSMSRNISLKVGNDSYERESVSHENDSVLLSQHNPGDLLFEIIFGVEYKGWIPPIGSSQEKTLIEIIKRQVQRKVKPFSDKVKEIKLKEIIRRSETQIDGQTDPDWMLIFWLHLTPKNKNVFHFVHSQLENLSGTSVEVGKVQTVEVTDVNECNSGIGLCGDEAICLNGYGTYLCKCKEDYEDRSETKSGTLCVRSPRSGLGSLYSFTEILVGTTVFFISALVVVISVLCTILKKRHTKKDFHFQEAVSPGTPDASEPPQTAFDQNNIRHLLTLDPAQLKLRAKAPEWPLEIRTGPSETYRVSIEQSDYL